jgi:hypothetical protein
MYLFHYPTTENIFEEESRNSNTITPFPPIIRKLTSKIAMPLNDEEI